MAGCTSVLYPQVLTLDEYNGIHENVRFKIEEQFKKLSDDCTVSKALLETNKINAEQLITNLQNELGERAMEVDSIKSQISSLNNELDEHRTKIKWLTEEKDNLSKTVQRLEAEAVALRDQRNLAVDERDNLLKIVERQNFDKDRMQEEVRSLSDNLQNAITAKCAALLKNQEVESMKLNLEFREKRMEDEKALMRREIAELSQQVTRLSDELMAHRSDSSIRRLQVETELTEKTEALKMAESKLENLRSANSDLQNRLENSLQKVMAEQKLGEQMQKAFNDELAQRDKLISVHSEMQSHAEENCTALKKGIEELRGLLKESVVHMEKYEKEKEVMQSNFERDLQSKEYLILKLEADLQCANGLLEGLKREKIESAIEEMSPVAASVSRMMGSGTSLSDMYSQWAQANEQLMVEKAENKRLNECISRIVEEVESKAPDVRKLREEHYEALAKIQKLCDALDQNSQERTQTMDEIAEIMKQKDHYEREFNRREREIKDLSRQVCHLLDERENKRSRQTPMRGNRTSPLTSSEVISEHLVTFSNIQELQENNKKLLALVRELSEKAEEEEEQRGAKGDYADLKITLEAREKELADTKDKIHQFEKMMKRAMTQLQWYRKSLSSLPPEQRASTVGRTGGSSGAAGDAPTSGFAELPHDGPNEVKKLQEKLQKTKKALEDLKEEFESYRAERQANDRLLQDQLETSRNQLAEMRMNGTKLVTQLDYSDERFKIVQANCDTYKSQISALEAKNKSYSIAIAKHETALEHMRNDVFNNNKKLSRAELTVENLRRECSMLRDAETRLLNERENTNNTGHSQSLLIANLDVIRSHLEHSEESNRMRLENRLDEVLSENAGIRRCLQEEQGRFRQLAENLEQEVNKAKKRYEEEKELVTRSRQEQESLKEELTKARTEIENLNKQIRDSKDEFAHLQKPAALIEAERKGKELEKQLRHLERDLKTAQEHLDLEKKHSKEFCKVSEVLEQKLKETLANFESYRESSEKRAAKAMERDEELNKTISTLECQLSSLQSGSNQSSAQLNIQLANSQKELHCVQQELDKAKQELASIRVEVVTLASSAQSAEEKYAHEVSLHSSDLKALLDVKEEFNALSTEVNDLKTAKALAEDSLKSGKENWEERETMMQHEAEEMQKRVIELDAQNEILHQQIEALGTKLSYLEARGFVSSAQPSPNTSFTNVDEDSLNKSLNISTSDEDVKASDHLLKIIKFLRQEKNLTLTKCDVVRAENSRLKSQLEKAEKHLDEARSSLIAERERKDVDSLTTAKHAEVLRKVETLSALTDSNRILRSERDSLQAQVKEFQLRVESLEKELGPLREKNIQLSTHGDSMDAENAALRGEAQRLRQRVNFLIERSSKTSPEDWRRLQQEREALARQVSADRETLQRKEDEIRVLRQEKTRLEEQVSNLTRHIQQQGEEIKRQADELNTMQQRLSRITQELSDTKNIANKKNEELAKITEDLGAKEALLTDVRNKEMQIRKIAKKYKTQWEELNRTAEDDKQRYEQMEKSLAAAEANAVSASRSAEIAPEAQEQLREEGRREVEMRIAEAETRHTEKVKELVEQVTSSREEADTLRKENDSLKSSSADKEERAKALLKQARGKIAQIQETNNNYSEKIKALEARLKSVEQGTEETVRMTALKSQYENRIARLEKECADLRAERHAKLDNYIQRISVLERQLEKYQGFQMLSASVLPWTSRGDAPFASIRPMAQSRTVAVLPVTSQAQCTSISPQTTVLVPPQQQVHTTAPTGSGSAESQSSSPTSSHADLVPMPATSSASSGGTAIRQAAVPPCTREEPPQSAQPVAESTQEMEAEVVINENLSQAHADQPELQQQQTPQQQDRTSVERGSSQEIELQQSYVQPTQQQQLPPQQQLALPQAQLQQQQPQTQQLQAAQLLQQQHPTPPPPPLAQQVQSQVHQQVQTHQQVPQQQSQPQLQPPTGAPSTQQAQVAVAMVLPRVDQQATATAVLSGQPQQVEQAAAAPSTQASSSNSTVTTSQAGGTAKRSREPDGEPGAEDEKQQGKRTRLGGIQQNVYPASSDSVLEVEYQVPTSSQRDQDEEIVESEEEEGIADEGVIEEPEDGQEFEEDVDNADGYAVGPYRDEPDLTSFEEVEGPDIDDENPQDPENNEAEIMDDSSEVPNQSGTASPTRQASGPPRPPTSQQHAEASSSGTTSSSGPKEIGSAGAGGVGTSLIASSGMGFSRGPARSVPPLARQQQQQTQLLLGYEESGDDSIVPSTPTLFVPRRSDGFGEAVSSPQVPQTRFTFSDANTPATRSGVSQGPSETIELNQLEEAGTGRSVPTTPPQVSPQESVEVGQSEAEGGGEAAIPQTEVQPEADGSQTTVPLITVTEAPEDETTEVAEEMPPPELAEFEEAPEQRDSGEQSSEQEEGLELADESGDGVSSEGEKSQPTEDIEEGREAEASEATEVQEAPRRVTRAANTARRSARGYRGPRGRAGMRPTPIVWNEPGPSMGSQSPRGRAAMMAAMRGNPNDQMRGSYPRGGPRSRRPRGKPKGNFSSPYQMRF